MAGNTYLSREQILGSEIRTRDVEAFGGTVLVKEMDALTMQKLMASGAFQTDVDGASALDFGKIDLVDLATRFIVDPDTLEPFLTKADVKVLGAKSWQDVMNVVTAAMEASGLGVKEDEGEPPKN